MQYGGNFLAVGGFSLFGVNDFGGSDKPKYGGILSAVMQYGGNFLAVSGFSFFGGNVNGKSKFGGNCGAQLALCIPCMFLAPEQTTHLLTLVHTF